MSDDQDRLIELFNEALTHPTGEERERYLDEVCASDAALRQRLNELLQAREQAGDFLNPSGIDLQEPLLDESPGDFIGRYKLLQQIGEGGFGRVWMAEQQEPVRRKVALKIIKLGMDTREVVARFEAERQALAHDGSPEHRQVSSTPGATPAGRPFFVMELVRGMPITDYCDQQQLSTERAARAVHQGLPRRAARAPEGHHPPRPQALEHPRHRARRRAGAEGHRLRRGQGHRAGA